VDISEDSQKLAIDIKEAAHKLSNITADLTDASNGNMTFKSIAKSSNEEVLTANYIGSNQTAGSSKEMEISVKQLATPQINTGKYLNPRARNLYSGTYSFDVNMGSTEYELQFSVKDEEKNIDVLNKLARLINKSNIGLNANLVHNPQDDVALSITSNMTGVGERPVIFNITDDNTSSLSGAVEAYGLNHTTQYPSNALFTLNGADKSSSSNNFTIDREYEISLKSINEEGDVVKVGLKQNFDSIVDSLKELTNEYNNLTALAKESNSSGGRRLYNDMTGVANLYRKTLTSNGITINPEGLLEINQTRLKEASDEGTIINSLSDLSRFKNALQHKAGSIMINPMEYINKTIISYKNPARPSSDPYMTSLYSGMMYNGYC
jgi:flagellar hook-associated protein 2